MPTTRWGTWSYDAKRFTLTYGPENYGVDLDECRNSAEVLDWILQVTHKTWITSHGARDFIHAINDILVSSDRQGTGVRLTKGRWP